MSKQKFRTLKIGRKSGFTITEAIITSAIIGTLTSIAYPSYTNANNSSKLANAEARIQSIPPIIGAFIDATGEAPSTWDDLTSIAAVMTNNGPATGDLETPITLPNSIYDLSIEGPTESVYTLTATRVIDRNNENSVSDDRDASNEEFKFAIKSCFNISNGASDLRSGNLSEIENTLNCG
jgi:prepilin-type N-terminal cleavage/methylation domain-containing protein